MKYQNPKYKIINILLIGLLIGLSGFGLPGCSSRDANGFLGSGTNAQFGSFKRIKILYGGSGATSSVKNLNLVYGNSLALKAAAFDMDENYQEDIEVSWQIVGTGFSQTDLNSDFGPSVTFNPTSVGKVTIRAIYTGEDPLILFNGAETGLITVTSDGTVDSLQIFSGNNQAGTVGTTLNDPLKVLVWDAFNQPLPGKQVTFSVVQGGGSISGLATVTSDSSGVAAVNVNVGGTAGIGAQVFRATSVDNGSLTVDFTATGIAAGANQAVFTTQPSGTYAGSEFSTQPVLEVRDVNGNLTNFSGTMTLTVQTGSGNLTGTTSVPISNGVATFTNVGYDTVEGGVILQASDGTRTALTGALTFTALPPGACQTNDSLFKTADGGCKDLTSGLVWSDINSSNLDWHAAVWDSTVPGSSPPDSFDIDRTNDYAEGAGVLDCGADCDSNSLGYCHDLVEGGYFDWRLPSQTEWVASWGRMTTGSPPYLSGLISDMFWTNSMSTGSTISAFVFDSAIGSIVGVGKWGAVRAYCVRDSVPVRQSAAQLEVISGPLRIGLNRSFSSYGSLNVGGPIVVQIADASGNPINREGVSVTLSSTIGTAGGVVSEQTNRLGRASFSDFTLDTAGSDTLSFASAGLTSTVHNIEVFPFAHGCKAPNAQYQTLDGGCKDTLSGLVWSAFSPGPLSWHDTIWDSTNPIGNDAPDASDGALTDHYGNSPGADPDASLANYCHDLVEGGFDDWRVPSTVELGIIYNMGVGANLQSIFDLSGLRVWSSETHNLFSVDAVTYALSDGSAPARGKFTSDIRALCVRD